MNTYKKMQRTNRIIPWLMLGVTLAGYGIWLYGLCTGYIRSIKGDDYLFQSVVSLLISSGLSMVILYIGYTSGESHMKTILKLSPNNLDLCYPIGHLSSLGVFALLYGMQCVTIRRNSFVNSPRQAVVDLDKLNCDGLCTLPDVRQRLIRLLKAPAPDRKISEKSVTLPLSEFAKVIEEALNQSKQTLLAGMTPTPRLSVFTFLCATLNVWLAPVMMITKLVFAFQRNKPSGILMMVLLFTIILCFYLTYVIHEAAYRWSQSSRLSFPKRKSSYGYAFKPFNSTAMTENERFELLRMAITSNNEQLLANSKALMTQQEHAFLHKFRYLSLYLQRVHMAADKAAHE